MHLRLYQSITLDPLGGLQRPPDSSCNHFWLCQKPYYPLYISPHYLIILRNLINSLNSLHIKFNVIGITESCIKLNVQPLIKINLKNYNTEETPTESEKGGALPYISSNMNYKVRKDLNIYEAKELESIFIEIINKNRKNCIIGCIYKHPKMSIQDFNNILMPTLEKISNENKDAYLIGDFNINLINYNSHNPVYQFLDGICSKSFLFTQYKHPYLSYSKI